MRRQTKPESVMEPFAWLSCRDPKLAEALDYLAQHPGKQLRSRLTISSAQLVAGGSVPAAIMAGEAIELLHTYSLVHDDLPAMDDDDLRRGQPTLHCAFDEATAILAGDGHLRQEWQSLRRRRSAAWVVPDEGHHRPSPGDHRAQASRCGVTRSPRPP